MAEIGQTETDSRRQAIRAEGASVRGNGTEAGSIPQAAATETADATDMETNTAGGLQRAGSTAVGAVHGTLNATEDIGSSLIHGASHLARELVHGVRDIGVDAAGVVVSGASGVLGAVGLLGGKAVHVATDVLVEAVGGVRQIAGAALGRRPGTETKPAAAPARPESPEQQTGRQPTPPTPAI